MPGRSNGLFLPLMPAPPLPDSGWSVKVISYRDLFAYARGANPAPLAQIFRFTALTWSPQISDVGAGSITLRTDDPVFSYALADGSTPDSLWRYENLWVVYEDGQWRGEFFGDKVEFPRVPAGEAAAKLITVSGPGAAQCLAWASVLSPYYPGTPPKNTIAVYQYKNIPVMASWLQLLAAAQRQSFIPYVHCRFSAAKDTGGATWEDTPAPKPRNTATAVVGDVMFTVDSSVLTVAGQKAVKAIADKLAKVTYPVATITGHASSEGTKAHNFQLGLDRANTVRNAILALRPLAQVDAVSKGESQPVASNRTAAGRRRNRRVVVTYQSSPAYVDTIFTPERGTTLLDLLRQLTSGQVMAENRGPIHCEWTMAKGFELHVRSMIGVDRSRQVVYHEGSTYLASETVSYDRSQIANVIAVQNDNCAYKVASDAASVRAWGQRVKYTAIQGSYADNVHALIANQLAKAYADEQVTTTVQVQPGPQRTPFRDYTIGDWIGLAKPAGRNPSTVQRMRVVSISVSVDADGNPAYELTLSSARQGRVAWLQTQVDALTARKKGIRAFIQSDEPTGGLPGDLWTPPPFTANV